MVWWKDPFEECQRLLGKGEGLLEPLTQGQTYCKVIHAGPNVRVVGRQHPLAERQDFLIQLKGVLVLAQMGV